jgi:hypothetical protein
MKQKTSNLMTLEEFKETHYGKTGTPPRDELEAGYENFKSEALLQQARHEKAEAFTARRNEHAPPPHFHS